MSKLNDKEIVALYQNIGLIFGNKYKLDEISVMTPIYAKWTYAEMVAALNVYAQESKFYPKPADLIAVAKRLREENNAAKAEEYRASLRYDEHGNRLYDCPYCQDGGYMHVMTKDIDFYTSCVHKHPMSHEALKRRGKFRLRLPRYEVDAELHWDKVRLAMVADDVKSVPEVREEQSRKIKQMGMAGWSGRGQTQSLFDDLPF